MGLLGVAVDPDFAVNRHIYVFYTHDAPGCVQRISRFTVGPDEVAELSSERILLDRIAAPNGNHSGGDLHFGRDGQLYVSVGDGGCDYAGTGCQADNDAARDRHVLAGKVLRITPEGGVPPDNPFTGPGTARCDKGGVSPGLVCQETFAWGFRNPFRMAFDPDDPGTRFFINDVGQDHWEEIDEAAPGADYGWNSREGFCATGTTDDCEGPPPGITDPVHAYSHDSGCVAITGGAFVPDDLWPTPYDDAYLFSDFGCGIIFELSVDGRGRAEAKPFASDLGAWSVAHLAFGPAGDSSALYYASHANRGEVRRIAYAGSRS